MHKKRFLWYQLLQAQCVFLLSDNTHLAITARTFRANSFGSARSASSGTYTGRNSISQQLCTRVSVNQISLKLCDKECEDHMRTGVRQCGTEMRCWLANYPVSMLLGYPVQSRRCMICLRRLDDHRKYENVLQITARELILKQVLKYYEFALKNIFTFNYLLYI